MAYQQSHMVLNNAEIFYIPSYNQWHLTLKNGNNYV